MTILVMFKDYECIINFKSIRSINLYYNPYIFEPFSPCKKVLSELCTDTAWQVESENIIMKYVVSCFEIFKCIHQI